MWDLSLPGYKYLGPGNKLNKGRPVNRDDAVALYHDYGYDALVKRGKNPYTQYSSEDEQARLQFTTDTWGGALGKAFFSAKKAAWKAGLIGHVDDMGDVGGKRGRDVGGMREGVKRLRGSDGPVKLWTKERQGPSVPDLTSATQASMSGQGASDGGGGDGSGRQGNLKETPVDNPFVVYRGPADFEFSSLPFVQDVALNFGALATYDHIFRMTSPYDVQQTTTIFDANAGAGTTRAVTESNPDTVTSKARWFDFYAGIYNYYHVISCRYSITVENLSMEPLYAHLMFMNDTSPPLMATNEDVMLWKNVRSQVMSGVGYAIGADGLVETGWLATSANSATVQDENMAGDQTANITYETGNNISRQGKHSCHFSGEYRPGDFKREVRLDSDVENWTLVNTNPTLPERLLLRLKPANPSHVDNDGTSRGDLLKARILTQLEYLVEFKELKDGLRWPVQRQPLTVTIAQSASSVN